VGVGVPFGQYRFGVGPQVAADVLGCLVVAVAAGAQGRAETVEDLRCFKAAAAELGELEQPRGGQHLPVGMPQAVEGSLDDDQRGEQLRMCGRGGEGDVSAGAPADNGGRLPGDLLQDRGQVAGVDAVVADGRCRDCP